MSFGACFFEQLASLFTRAVAEIRELLGVAITHGDTTDYYAMDVNADADTAPASGLTPDTTITYDMIMG